MIRPLITLTTDFKTGSAYVAALKGVILSINPDVGIVDITHDIPPQDIHQGALAMAEATPRFPLGSIHVGVVDPEVGTQRGLIYATIGGRHYVAPDNGLLDRLASNRIPDKIIALSEPQFWQPQISSTFHGRDIMAPVAAHLSLGIRPEQLGTSQPELVRLDWPEVRIVPGKVTGSIQSIDSFGNLVTDITDEMLVDVPHDESVSIRCDEHQTQGIFDTYADQPQMTLIALIGSQGNLELAIVGDSAKMMLGVSIGTPVTVSW